MGGKRHPRTFTFREHHVAERETAEDQDSSFCRSHVKVDEQFKQGVMRCKLNIPQNGNSLSAVIAFNALRKKSRIMKTFKNQDCKERDRAILNQLIMPITNKSI